MTWRTEVRCNAGAGKVLDQVMLRVPRPKTPIVQPAARARALAVQAAHKAARARVELAIVIPLIAGILVANAQQTLGNLITGVVLISARPRAFAPRCGQSRTSPSRRSMPAR